MTAVLGYGHKPPVLSRNLPLVRTGYPADDQTDHCVGLVWSPGMVINLNEWLAPKCAEFADTLAFLVSGAPSVGGVVSEIPEPEDLEPAIIHAEVLNCITLEALDRIWIVVNSPKAKQLFDEWVASNASNIAWTLSLPPPPERLIPDLAGEFHLPSGSVNFEPVCLTDIHPLSPLADEAFELTVRVAERNAPAFKNSISAMKLVYADGYWSFLF